ncbi:MAG: metal-sulfur cluster assembly factor [Daejeonella sp.]|uniref:metal-sulfur cluster assembly factor n=1 Tax=Daejeonella sp. TaxID=2805397 RepID=UPI003C79703E
MSNFDNTDELEVSRAQVIEALAMIIDPELGINIVDMGLLYFAEIDGQGKNIFVEMTLSSRGCPMGAAILGGSETILKSYFPGYIIDVKLVWEPAWTPDFISEEGRRFLE